MSHATVCLYRDSERQIFGRVWTALLGKESMKRAVVDSLRAEQYVAVELSSALIGKDQFTLLVRNDDAPGPRVDTFHEGRIKCPGMRFDLELLNCIIGLERDVVFDQSHWLTPPWCEHVPLWCVLKL
jgi:hypothetical protein